jgi:predicted dehydrogenase
MGFKQSRILIYHLEITMAYKRKMTRRQFVGAAAGAAAFTIVPRHVLGTADQPPPSEKINIAGIGVGGQGGGDLGAIASDKGVNVVALCDADLRAADGSFKKWPEAKQYRDFRKMFEEMDKQIDAVVVATPDHFHAVAAVAAMKRGKHVYCEKPMAHSIYEVREMVKAAKENNVITQLGNQGHSSETIRMLCEWIWDNGIGMVSTIHAGCSANHSKISQLPSLKEQHPVPKELDWDLWLGPAAFRPYHPVYLPFTWRGWMPFGTGTIGDWTCHVIDPVFWAFDLGAPTSIKAEAKDYDPKLHADTFPAGSIIRYEFPAKNNRGPIELIWHDGVEKIPRADDMESNAPDTGAVVIGTTGGITYGSHGAGGVRMYPESKMQRYKRPAPKIPRVPKGNHQFDWLEAIRKKTKAGSDFSYGGPLTEIALLGVIAIRLLGQELKWDSAAMKFTNSEEANAMIKPTFREGWTL